MVIIYLQGTGVTIGGWSRGLLIGGAQIVNDREHSSICKVTFRHVACFTSQTYAESPGWYFNTTGFPSCRAARLRGVYSVTY